MIAQSTRDACLRAFLSLVEERGFERVSFADVATRAGVPLSQMRVAYASLFDLVLAFSHSIDRAVLARGEESDPGEGDEDELNPESPRERLFEVLMRRFDALEPHKGAVAALLKSSRCHPVLAGILLKAAISSQRWMLAAAGVASTGLKGDMRARGLALVYARVVQVWLRDEGPGLDRTMAALDLELRRGAKALDMLDDLAFIALPWRTRRANAGSDQTAAHCARSSASSP